jgi:N-acetylmuramate 1-kinase
LSLKRPDGGDTGHLLPEEVARFLSGAMPRGLKGLRFMRLQGDASDRSYLRLSSDPPGEPGRVSFVLMQLARPWSPEYGREEIPFVNIARHLSEKRIPVPRVWLDASRQGAVLLEDVGDSTLEMHLRECSGEERTRCYLEALEVLVRMQKEASRPSRLPCYALSYAFDTRTFFRELCFFREHAVEGLWKRKISPAARRALDRHFWDLCQEVASYPQTFTHRDYHARNLMVQDSRLRVLDFQDARLGPWTYDLASLLRDSYVHLEPEEEEFLRGRYTDSARAAGLRLPGPGEFGRAFRRTAIQRNLKAIGTFAYQTVVRGADGYLASIPNTLRSLRRAFGEEPELDPLCRLLRDLVEGW